MRSIQHLGQMFKKYRFEIQEDINIEESELSVTQQVSIYRIIQEGLLNVARHANASVVQIYCHVSNQSIHLDIKDNGSGLKQGHSFSMGLKGIESRVTNLLGSFDLLNQKNGGTILSVKIPRNS